MGLAGASPSQIWITSGSLFVLDLNGYEQGLQQGLQQERELILEAVDERFGEIPPSVSETINQIEDQDRLKTTLRQVIRAVSMEEFQQSLNGGDGQESFGD